MTAATDDDRRTAEDRLAAWLADEQRIRQRIKEGQSTATPMQRADLARLPGIAAFDATFEGRLAFAPIGETLDFLPILIEPGRAIFQGTPLPKHYNPMGTVHGGWFATLLDSALGCAVHSNLPAGRAYTTLELKVNLVRALTERVPRVRAEGRLIHFGNQTATAEATLTGSYGKLYAHATTTCLIFPSRA